MKAHIGVDAGSGLAHSATFTAANAADITEAAKLAREDDEVVHADAGHTGLAKRPEIVSDEKRSGIEYRISEKIGKRRRLCDPVARWCAGAIEKRKSSARSKVEHVFRIVRIQLGHVRTACRGLNEEWQQDIRRARDGEPAHACHRGQEPRAGDEGTGLSFCPHGPERGASQEP